MTGNVGIGTWPNPDYRLFINGPAYSTGGWQGSSIHLKTGIERLAPHEEQALLKKVSTLSLYRYRYKQHGDLKTTHLGIIAEEAPDELVDDHHKALSYGDTLAVLLAAVKVQQQQLAAQQTRIERLERQLQPLNSAQRH